MKKCTWVILLGVMALSGCRDTATTTSAPKTPLKQKPPAVQAVNANITRDTSPPVALEDVDVLTAGINAFGLDMYQALSRDQAGANLFFSPYSISEALAMAYAGARGATARQMSGALHFSAAESNLHARFDGLFLALENPKKQFGGKGHAPFSLNTANAMWGQKAFIDVNEKGAEAAAATAVTGDGAAAPQASPVTITLDRPFIYCIHDAHTNLILFIGRIMDPSA
jgi:serpin B